jgi:hypothetical protein
LQDLNRTLSDYDLELLRVIANRWDVDLNSRDAKQAAEQLASAMLQPERAADAWDRLTDEQRGALQTLLGAGGRMPTAVFSRLFGEIRPMGPGRMEREKPYLNPASLAEALYYRGLIAMTFGEGVKGSQAFTYVPDDLALLLPAHKTGYSLTEATDSVEPVPLPNFIRLADTNLVDDLTTLLAYCQVNDVALAGGTIDPEHQKALKPHLLGTNSTARLALLVAVAGGMGIAVETPTGFKPVPGAARRWLDAPRPVQVRAMAEAWRDSIIYNELWYTPNLKVERTGSWQSDPLLARQTVLTFLELVPSDEWWPVDTFVNAVKEEEPDFQRPSGDYDSWYIRDAQTGNYLRGFESWDMIDGAVLRFILTGPMHGLGLVDTAENGDVCRLTAYGRAFTGTADWPSAAVEEQTFTISPDGLCEVPRSFSRYDRFQLARFTEWIKAADPYQYRISAAGLAQATKQSIQASNILTFLKRGSGDKVPDPVVALIETWAQSSADSAVISQMTVLRVPTAELLAAIQATPALRRYLGATLGPTAVAVRPGQWNDLAAALQANGVLVEVDIENAPEG